MNRDIYRWFSPQRGFRQVRPFLIVFGIFILAGFLPIIFGLTAQGIAVIGLGVLFYAFIIPSAAAWGRKYGLGDEKVLLKTAFSEKVLRFKDIASAALLSKDESRRFMEELYKSTVDSERQMDISSWYKSTRRAGDVVRYLSIPVTGTEIRRGYATNITDYSVRPRAELILLRTDAGGFILISPQNIRDFFNELLQKGVSNIPAAVGEGLAVQAEIRISGVMKKHVRRISIITLITTVLLVGYFVIYPQLMKSQPDTSLKQTAENSETAEPSSAAPAGLLADWEDDNSFVFGVLSSTLPEMEREGGVTAHLFKAYAGVQLIMLLESGGEIPAGSSARADLFEYIGDFLLLHSQMFYAGEETTADGDYVFFQVEQTAMRESVASLIRNF
ncbi:MAG: hypothetical protein JEZ04_19020 [Spirochaetales bacterium]|nr:hypothetical protein [Spirochaetales bacterium]